MSSTWTPKDPAYETRDGARIAFTGQRDGNLEIYSMASHASGQINLTNHPALDSDPTWSP